ncbi:MAG: radical SAM protein [Bacilli bacterium]|nr:radical SAM protein [Bacilli bacterium]
MQIGKIFFPISSLGIGTRLGIWVVGCLRNCKGCANPELQYFDEGKDAPVVELYKAIKDYPFTGVTISGGEPFLQAKDLAVLIRLLVEKGIEDILVFTGFTLEELKAKNDDDINYILANIAVLIDGPFIESKFEGHRLKGSSNQRIFYFKKEFEKAYEDYISDGQHIDYIPVGDEVHFIGIPFPGFRELYPKMAGMNKKGRKEYE